MRSLITAILVAIGLALVFASVLNSFQQSSETAFKSEGVRLGAASSSNGKLNIVMTDLLNGAFVILGAIIAAVAGYVGAVKAARAQVKAVRDQTEEEQMRFQQKRHQKKYEVAFTLSREAQRLAGSAEKRIPLALRVGFESHEARTIRRTRSMTEAA
jgi:nucleoside permease NupC